MIERRRHLTSRLLRSLEAFRENSPAREAGERASGPCLGRFSEFYSPEEVGFPPDLFGVAFEWEVFRNRFRKAAPVAFWDVETCGLGDAPVFLVGILFYPGGGVGDQGNGKSVGETSEPEGLRFESFLARDPAQEPRLIREAAEVLGSARLWVTFNGRCFDHPRLRKRAFRHRVEFPEPPFHTDLLLEVRRRWRGILPDCRLGTVEKRLLGLQRSAWDIPGREVPERYRKYVETGDIRVLEPVVEHNRRDVLAMAALFLSIQGSGSS